MLEGERLAWDTLDGLDPEEVCRKACAAYGKTDRAFTIKIFSRYVSVFLNRRSMLWQEGGGDSKPVPLHDKTKLSILEYLIHASDTPFSGKLINPTYLSGGQIYRDGSHVLPLASITKKYGTESQRFIARGRELDGRALSLADASFMLFPFPRIAVAILLWLKDAEFPARALLLVDSSCNLQLPPDIMWLTLMMCLEAVSR